MAEEGEEPKASFVPRGSVSFLVFLSSSTRERSNERTQEEDGETDEEKTGGRSFLLLKRLACSEPRQCLMKVSRETRARLYWTALVPLRTSPLE